MNSYLLPNNENPFKGHVDIAREDTTHSSLGWRISHSDFDKNFMRYYLAEWKMTLGFILFEKISEMIVGIYSRKILTRLL
eukprot:snap_masked-scaffold_21-processed-gene-3.33-mRNA-1 protein AED:1.00 eAED:1.00 QI:0/0/0/0/1/1/2/0/79